MPEGDDELAAAWTALEGAFDALQPLAATVGDLLEAAGAPDYDEAGQPS
jgi:hypothetical protein